MSNMKTATVRQVQHQLREVLGWVAAGQSVRVTQRGRIVATVVPPEKPKKPVMPDFAARLRADFPRGVKGKPASEIISEQREERC